MSSSRKPRSASTSPVRGRRSRSLSRSTIIRSRSQVSADAENPGNNLFVTGLPTWINDSHLHKYFSKKGKAKRSGRTQTPGRYRGSKDKQGHGSGRSCSYSPMQRQDRDYYSRDWQERSRSPYRMREEEEDYSDKYRRRRD